MPDDDKDAAVLQALIERFEKQRLPRALALKEKVDKGELLSEWDTAYLEEVFEDSERVKAIVDEHPEYQELYARAVHLYNTITEKGLENAKASGDSS